MPRRNRNNNNRKQMRSFRKNVPKRFRQEVKREKMIVRRENRQRNRTRPTVIGKAIRGVGRLAGSYLGVGGLGEAVGAGVSRIFGQGDYVMPLRNSLMVNGVPSFSPLTSGFRIRHREYITDVQSSVGFASTSYQLNPGISDLFPWLSAVAQNFEEYKVHGMVVYLNTTSATAVSSTNTALGVWGAVTVYDPSEDPFTTKQQCENYVGCQTAVPSCSLVHGIECKPSVNVLDKFFVRSGNLPDPEDLKFFDLGKIQIFTQGSQAVSTIGEMWVSYDIEFMKPRLPTSGENLVSTDRFYSATGVADASPLGTNTVALSGSTLGSTINSSGTTITIPSTAPNTNYVIILGWTKGSVTEGTPAVNYGGSLIAKNYFLNNTANNRKAPQSGALLITSTIIVSTFAKISSGPGIITVVSPGLPATANVDIMITQVSANFSLPLKLYNKRLDVDEILRLRKMLRSIRFEEDEEEKETYEQRVVKDSSKSRAKSPSYFQEWPQHDPNGEGRIYLVDDKSNSSYSDWVLERGKGTRKGKTKYPTKPHCDDE